MKKKVLIVADSLSTGGLEKTLIDLCNNLDHSKYAVDLYLFAPGRDLVGQLDRHVRLLPDSPWFSQVFCTGVGKSLMSLLKKGRVDLAFYRIVRFLKARFHRTKLTGFDWFFQKRTMLRLTDAYDAAVGFAEGSAGYYVAQCVDAKVKSLWVHTDIREIETNAKLDRMAFSAADHICTVSQNSLNALKERYPDYAHKMQAFLLPSLFDFSRIDALAQQDCGMESGFVNIVSVGRLVELKGFHLCPGALRQLLDEGHAVRWYFVGDGSQRPELEQLRKALGLEEYMFLVGNQENPYRYIAHGDICVQPSSYEGMSLVVYEEKYLKKPVVATGIPGNLEMLEHGENSLIVERSTQSIYEALRQLLTDAELRDRLGKTPAKNYVTKEETMRKIELTVETVCR